MTDWLWAFALTVLIEMPFVAAVASGGLRRRAAIDSVLANLCTHPVAWVAVLQARLSWGGVEAAVAVAEALIYWRVTRMELPRAVVASLLANGVSAAVGLYL